MHPDNFLGNYIREKLSQVRAHWKILSLSLSELDAIIEEMILIRLDFCVHVP
jgi:hypothetical protein